jgi:hypothetical protein
MGTGKSKLTPEEQFQQEQKRIQDQQKQQQEHQLFLQKFTPKNQDCAALDTLLQYFRDGDHEKALELVQSINRGLLPVPVNATFKGAMRNALYDSFMKRVCLKAKDWVDGFENYYFCDNERCYFLSVDGVKPILVAYYYTFHNVSALIKGEQPDTNKGLKWLQVTKEMSKNPVFKAELTDSVFGVTLLQMMTYKSIKAGMSMPTFSVYWGSGSQYQSTQIRPFVFDKELFTQWLTGAIMSDSGMLQGLIADHNYRVLEVLLDTADCKEALKKNLLYFVEHYRAPVNFVTLLQKHGQSASVVDPAVSNNYCYDYCLQQRNYGNFMEYKDKPSVQDSLAIFAKYVTTEDLKTQGKAIADIIAVIASVHTKESAKTAIDMLLGKQLFSLANFVSDKCTAAA